MRKISFIIALLLGISLLAMASYGQPRVTIRKIKSGAYQLLVDNRPYFVKGVCYSPVPIGKAHDYDFWSDPNEPWKVDGKLMKDMGVNTVRFYNPPKDTASGKKVINDLYRLYGIRSIMGSWLGFWEYPCPKYGDEEFRQRIKKEVLDMVMAYKDEQGILLWVLGNENNYSFNGRINPWTCPQVEEKSGLREQCGLRAYIYYSFINEVAGEIHKIDPNHPVALGNGELLYLDIANEACKDVDLVALLVYRGKGFGNIFKSLSSTFDKPLLMIEFGADSYDAYLGKEDQNMQALFLESQWRQLIENAYPDKEGLGNCIGGTSFEWGDEWWKHDEASSDTWAVHDTTSNWSNGSYYFDIKAPRNMNMNEEWFGIVEQSSRAAQGINKRVPRKAYYVIKELWRGKQLKDKLRAK